jgi:tRNA A37 threonylcarbamoyladenosine synthetase subunit TsaC/SUA5/YrdC
MDLAVNSFNHTVSLRCPRHRKTLAVLEESGELEEDAGAEC